MEAPPESFYNESVKITDAGTVVDFIRKKWPTNFYTVESFCVMYFNRNNNIIAYNFISSGGVTSTVVDVKYLLFSAINLLASAIILVHNHPSQNPTPSQHDRNITKKITDAAKLIDITVLDHIIITETEAYSLEADQKI